MLKKTRHINHHRHFNRLHFDYDYDKLRCKKSFFAENYKYISWKYNISDCDWYTNITCLMGEVKIKQQLLYPVSHDASVLHDLCSMRDDDFCKMFNKTQLDQLIIDISIN